MRLSKVFDVIKNPKSGNEVVKQAIRSLINYAEVNSSMVTNEIGEVLLSMFSIQLNDPDFLIPILWVCRNLTVTGIKYHFM